MKLIIQIPAYNEENTIGRTLAELPRNIDRITEIEYLVIDDGSSDGTVQAAKRGGAHHVVRLLNHRGLATAFLAGIDASLRLGADIIVNTDADNQYRAADIPKLIAPILDGKSEVVIGDRDTTSSPHMSPLKRLLQRSGSWAVGLASGVKVPDATSGFRAFSRDAAFQINVFNPFTYTLETIIQAGNRNLGVTSVKIGTNPPTRPSRLYHGMFNYVRKSAVTIFRIYTIYKPLKTFFLIGGLLLLGGFALGARFLFFYISGMYKGGHTQSLILCAVLLIAGFQTILIGLVADLISVNRRLSEDILVRMKKLDQIEESQRPRKRRDEEHRGTAKHHRPERAAAAPEPLGTQWVWLIDEAKLDNREAAAPAATSNPSSRRRRRRRPSSQQREQRPPQNDDETT